MFCKNCGKEIDNNAYVCINCGVKVANEVKRLDKDKENNVIRFLLTFFLGWIGSFIINHSSLKPYNYKSRTLAYFFLSMITFGIYGLVASIFNLTFDPAKGDNVGYFKESILK